MLAVLTVAFGWGPDCNGADAGPSPIAPPGRTGPKVLVDEEQYNFGKIDVGVDGRHAFEFTNVGDKPLVLTSGKTTCGCCTCVCNVRIPDGVVAPGDSAQVTLEWKSKLYVGPFRQTATILTNDPDRREVTLLIAGRFAGPVGVVPSQVSFSSLRLGQSELSEVHVYNYLKEPLDIIGYELSNPQSAEFFDVTWNRLSTEQLQREKEAQGGYLVRIAVRPGLSVGAFQQGIVLRTNSKSVPRVDIPVQGLVVNDISITGRGWNAQTGVLAMGTVKSGEGADWPLLIVVRGPHAKDIRLKHIRSVPSWLVVEFEPTRYLDETAISLTRLKIRVPPGSPPSLHLGAERGEPGRVTIQSDPPLLPELNLQVRFAVCD